jgi:hypothetical protein
MIFKTENMNCCKRSWSRNWNWAYRKSCSWSCSDEGQNESWSWGKSRKGRWSWRRRWSCSGSWYVNENRIRSSSRSRIWIRSECI